MVTLSRRREMLLRAYNDYLVSIRVACLVFSILLGCYHYQRKLSDENAEIADWLLPLTSINNTLGFGLFFIFT